MILKIKNVSIENGIGARVSIFLAGCDVHCKDCFQPETWNPDQGEYFSLQKMLDIVDLCRPEYIEGLSILGGDPMAPYNMNDTAIMCDVFKHNLPQKNIWVYTGHIFETLPKYVLEHIDVIVDGPFREELRDPSLPFRGSSNQRIIDVQKSLKENRTVLFME